MSDADLEKEPGISECLLENAYTVMRGQGTDEQIERLRQRYDVRGDMGQLFCDIYSGTCLASCVLKVDREGVPVPTYENLNALAKACPRVDEAMTNPIALDNVVPIGLRRNGSVTK